MAELGIKRQDHWVFRFTVMTTLSVVVAVMGLSADSAAVVIGAMLLAPLMQPVLATAACIAMALFQKSLRSFTVVVLDRRHRRRQLHRNRLGPGLRAARSRTRRDDGTPARQRLNTVLMTLLHVRARAGKAGI